MSYSLAADGEVIAEGGELFDLVAVPAEPATYELTLDTARDADWWTTSTETNSVWRFESEHVGGGQPEDLPILQVDYELALDEYNIADAPTPIRLRPYNLAERDLAPTEIADLRAFSSVDDGATWVPIALTDAGEGWSEGAVAIPASCDPTCFVSLLVETADTEGNALQQEITRAYQAAYVAPTPTTPVPTTTLPPTGAGDTGSLAGLGLVVLALGAIAANAATASPVRAASAPPFLHDQRHGVSSAPPLVHDQRQGESQGWRCGRRPPPLPPR